MDVGEFGGMPGHGLIRIVDKYFHESEREHAFECLSYASGIGAIDSDGEYLGLFLSRNLVCESR